MEKLILSQYGLDELKEVFKEVIREEVKNFSNSITYDEKPLYGSRKEVSEALHISLTTLYELTKTGVLIGYRIQGRILYKWTEVDQALQRVETLKFKRNQ